MKYSSKNQNLMEEDVVQQSNKVLFTEQATRPGFSSAYLDSLPSSSEAGWCGNGSFSPQTDVRESMRVLPKFIQPLLTWVTGKPLQGQRPLWKGTPYISLAIGLLQLFGAVAASVIIMHAPPVLWPMLILSWMVTAGSARLFQVTIIHHAVHYNFSGNKARERRLIEVLSTLLLLQDFVGYRYDHVSVHHSKKLATLDDPDLKFLWVLGFRPGMAREALWKHLIKTMLSPRFHFLFLLARLTANFKNPALYRKSMAVIFNGVVLCLVVITHTWLVWLIAWVLPLTVFYHISALLQFASEHRWLQVHDPDQPAKIVLARLTVGRFMGESIPTSNTSPAWQAVAWVRWLTHMLLIHLLFRVFVVAGDLPQHDWHHRHPSSKEWPTAAYARQRDLEEGCPGWPEPYAEVWGLLPAIDAVFRLLSSLPPPETLTPMPLAEKAEVLNGM
jgi:hypothetical protein